METPRELSQLHMVASLEQLRAFSGSGKGIHTDQAAAEAAGFRAPNAASAQYVQFIYSWLLENLACSSHEFVGTLDVKFKSPLEADESFILSGSMESSGDPAPSLGRVTFRGVQDDGRLICEGSCELGEIGAPK